MLCRELQCQVMLFLYTYTGLLLTMRRLRATQLQPGNKLCTWRVSLKSHGGRLVLVKTSLAAILVHAMTSFGLLAKSFAGIMTMMVATVELLGTTFTLEKNLTRSRSYKPYRLSILITIKQSLLSKKNDSFCRPSRRNASSSILSSCEIFPSRRDAINAGFSAPKSVH